MEEVNSISNVASENVDFSMFALFMSADLVVKSVIILLIACSIFSWALIFDKIRLFKNINSSIEESEKYF